MTDWRPEQYLLFEQERTRPCHDLVSQIRVDAPRTVIDLGCGPGNSTAALAARWPAAKITGLDNSAEMLARASQSDRGREWVEGDIAEWSLNAREQYDVVFSNAALQWVDNHAAVYPRLLARVADGGALAIQVPADIDAPAHRIMRDLAGSTAWRARFPGKVREWFVHEPAFYYDLMTAAAMSVTIWETTYIHVMASAESIAQWYRGTGLRPFLSALGSDQERENFVKDYARAVGLEFQPRADGRVLFPFHRLFLIAAR